LVLSQLNSGTLAEDVAYHLLKVLEGAELDYEDDDAPQCRHDAEHAQPIKKRCMRKQETHLRGGNVNASHKTFVSRHAHTTAVMSRKDATEQEKRAGSVRHIQMWCIDNQGTVTMVNSKGMRIIIECTIASQACVVQQTASLLSTEKEIRPGVGWMQVGHSKLINWILQHLAGAAN
jgi:hypothetical protein